MGDWALDICFVKILIGYLALYVKGARCSHYDIFKYSNFIQSSFRGLSLL